MRNHRWLYAYWHWTAHGDPDRGRWVCRACGTTWTGDHKPRGSRMYKKIGILADCEAQLVSLVMGS